MSCEHSIFSVYKSIRPAVWHKLWKTRFATHFWRKIKTHILQRCWPAAGNVFPCGSDFRCMGKFQMLFELIILFFWHVAMSCKHSIFSVYESYAPQFDIKFEKPGLQHIFEEKSKHTFCSAADQQPVMCFLVVLIFVVWESSRCCLS